MLTHTANGDTPTSFWPRVREFAVPPSMIETATARRRAGDWAGACAAAGIDVDLQPRAVARTHGRELAALLRADLRHLAPDLLRWHLPRIAPDGLLRPGLTIGLARYDTTGTTPLHLVVRTPPAWADAGQRLSLALWDASDTTGRRPPHPRHPHPRPSRRFRLDLHRHLWDARRVGELRVRAGADLPATDGRPAPGPLPQGHRRAVERWAAEAEILLRAEGRPTGRVAVRLGARNRLVLDVSDGTAVVSSHAPDPTLPVLPDAATWVLPDLELLRAGAIDPGRLHPLVAPALGVERTGTSGVREDPGDPRQVECRGARHTIGLVDGTLAALDHAPDEIRREELLAALGGPPLPCLQAIDRAHRRPDCLLGVRERLRHGDVTGALAAVESLLGPEAVLRDGPLRDALETAARRRVAHGLFRAGLDGPPPGSLRPWDLRRSREQGPHPRHM
ncbi:hypothetical protein ACFC4C_21200 [Streptomyces sp. NPDC056039]|uniref:hypothetical protein n=1 Tax=Streptomyces sp. NPDC056039 TaxID=3345687 RepID=UPI0035E3B995